jgi:hypothetical protein
VVAVAVLVVQVEMEHLVALVEQVVQGHRQQFLDHQQHMQVVAAAAHHQVQQIQLAV